MYSISRQLIDKTIESMNTRIADKIRNRHKAKVLDISLSTDELVQNDIYTF